MFSLIVIRASILVCACPVGDLLVAFGRWIDLFYGIHMQSISPRRYSCVCLFRVSAFVLFGLIRSTAYPHAINKSVSVVLSLVFVCA